MVCYSQPCVIIQSSLKNCLEALQLTVSLRQPTNTHGGVIRPIPETLRNQNSKKNYPNQNSQGWLLRFGGWRAERRVTATTQVTNAGDGIHSSHDDPRATEKEEVKTSQM